MNAEEIAYPIAEKWQGEISEGMPAGDARLMIAYAVREVVQSLREAGLLLEWRPNNPETAETLAEIYGSIPVNVTYVKDGKIKEVFETCAVDAHLYSPFGASHVAIIKPPEQTND